ncbi:MAG: ankyrin repeat domain-containing protein [Elusimicrobia bacterium]|nr:ankyrin repeat domain-containing protein [Elusimicrobiota bacterium]
MKRLLPLAACLAVACAAPMASAIRDGREGEVRRLLDEGQGLEALLGAAKQTPLELAAERGRLDIVRLLVERGAPVDARRKGTGALSLAALRGHRDVVEFLLSKGARPTARDVSWAKDPEIAASLRAAAPAEPPREENAAEAPEEHALVIRLGPRARVDDVRERLEGLDLPGEPVLLRGEKARRALDVRP